MWTIREVKERGKAAFKANFWRSVFVAFILTLCAGAAGAASGSMGSNTIRQESGSEDNHIDAEEFNTFLDNELAKQGITLSDEDKQIMVGAVILVLLAVMGIAIVIGSIVRLLLFNPLAVGCNGFFLKNIEGEKDLDSMSLGFKHYGRNVLTMFLMQVFLTLWTMLFIIPGLIKLYSYRMVPYILAEDPDVGAVEAITRSRQIMKGNKWKAFVLDFSFIGWFILEALTLGILGVFYVNPYYYSTDAALYEAIK
ncbi:MAG: DUF975 family protein [Lachnospiraceae bacterium]|nr:DUF975 family protein [Lachnospiraceae bacterium]